ncbi:type IV pilus modification protein PilV [Variovorax rhizosphaerae]|uniref:Type IV pilus modification protein PilV n=1 Tax=Variovorax rhizosphaerae TaxID=1836200 RepID=A0ABU8WSK0_9BURK
MQLNAQRISQRQGTRQRGVTLLESLVSILILAVGVLAILWVQVRTLAETQTSARRAQAVRAIEDLGERIKSNPDAFAQLNAYVADWDIGDAPAADCRAKACTTAQLAARDLWEWKTEVAQRLPLGKATVFLSSDEDANNKRQLGVMVGWRSNERSDDKGYLAPLAQPAPSATGTPSCPTGLICHVVYVQP